MSGLPGYVIIYENFNLGRNDNLLLRKIAMNKIENLLYLSDKYPHIANSGTE